MSIYYNDTRRAGILAASAYLAARGKPRSAAEARRHVRVARVTAGLCLALALGLEAWGWHLERTLRAERDRTIAALLHETR